MMQDAASRYLVKWLCHDLATPVGGVLTASELMDPATADAELVELVQGGARRLAGRLQLLRVGLGAAGSPMGNAALEKLVRAGLDGVAIDWQRSGDADGDTVALVAGAALLVADQFRLRALVVGNAGISVAGGAAWPESVAAALAGDAPLCNRGAVAGRIADSAARLGLRLVATANGLEWRAKPD
jgi:hypothetical protein